MWLVMNCGKSNIIAVHNHQVLVVNTFDGIDDEYQGLICAAANQRHTHNVDCGISIKTKQVTFKFSRRLMLTELFAQVTYYY